MAPMDAVIEVYHYQRRYAGNDHFTDTLLPMDGANWKPETKEHIQGRLRKQGIEVAGSAWVLDRCNGSSLEGWVYSRSVDGVFDRSRPAWAEDTHIRRRRWAVTIKRRTPSNVTQDAPAVEVAVTSRLRASAPQALSSAALVERIYETQIQFLPAAEVSAAYVLGDLEEVPTVKVVEVYENQRYYPLRGWSTSLLPTDRSMWSTKDGYRVTPPAETPLPSGWRWTSEWCIVEDHGGPHIVTGHRGGEAEAGWEYALDFYRKYSSHHDTSDCVRRRCWRRIMKKVHFS